MKIEASKCDRHILKEILEVMPDYRGETWGNMPIWSRFYEMSDYRLCVTSGDVEWESVCLECLFKEYNDE